MIFYVKNVNKTYPTSSIIIQITKMTTNNNTTPSIYIHRAHSGCEDPDVFRNTFNGVLGADCVRSVDLIKKTDKNDIPFIRAFIHFKFWPRGETAYRMHKDLMMDKRIEITYNHDTKWFWRFCRSKIPARDDPNTPPRKNSHKSKYGNKKSTDIDAGDVYDYPVLKRTETIGYKETSQRKVSNKPAWMTDRSHTTQSMSIDETSSASDDGE